MKDKKIIIAWLPMVTSCIMIPILILIGGKDLGAYGTNSATLDSLVTLMWIFIPLGLVISIYSSLMMFVIGIMLHNSQKIRESIYLFLCCILFPLILLLLNSI